MLACECLNVIIETESTDYAEVNADHLRLSEDEAKDIFFKQKILQIGKLTKINKAQACLIITRDIGSWLIHECINCNTCTHAVHREKGAGLVLVSSKLLATSVLDVRKSKHFSPVFNIVVRTNDEDLSARSDYLSNDMEMVVTSLKQQLSECINKKVTATDESVRKFTDQQYAALDEYKEVAHREHRALRRVILNSKLNNPVSTKMETSAPLNATSKSAKVPEENNFNSRPAVAAAKSPLSPGITPRGIMQSPEKVSIHRQISQKNSLDAEGLFPLEDMEYLDDYSNYDSKLSDNEEDVDEGIPIKAGKANQYQLNQAKSLPMNIPVFLSPANNHLHDEPDDLRPEESMDIAASIKALAKSVHGDTVFGDLPRPRCRTNI
ncbi:PREDICTED: uncharacterized protein LOC108559757 [Nicrophorus vespilloides]|uniref:Uncharacterized protein LOC108559757 n=1 Tax=Nicrophorus vespilloides TaxID=110193 RepID=A0ABM1MDE1_NICVS|nr:PREDICTED: uncharacterized protein LOC108559757 [Nicrophorus vespilloides]